MGLLERVITLALQRLAPPPVKPLPEPLPERAPFDISASYAHRLLLGEFVDCGNCACINGEFWSEVLDESSRDAIDRFCDEGWLVPTPLARKMELTKSQGLLREMAHKHGLKNFSSTEALIAQLIAIDGDGLDRRYGCISWLSCSPEAAKWALEPLIRTGTRSYRSGGCIVKLTPAPAGNHSAARHRRIMRAVQKAEAARATQAAELPRKASGPSDALHDVTRVAE